LQHVYKSKVCEIQDFAGLGAEKSAMMKSIYSNKQVAVQRQPSDSKMMEKNPYSSLFIGFILCGPAVVVAAPPYLLYKFGFEKCVFRVDFFQDGYFNSSFW
jgi:hypothetical protein